MASFDPELDDATPSKTQRKQAMHERQALALALLALPDEQLDDIAMDEPLREALRALRRLRSHEARRRQAQYVGKLARQSDPAPLRAALEAHRLGKQRAEAAIHRAEQWRERLLQDESALTAWQQAHPQTDLQHLRNLVRNARREQAAAGVAAPAHGTARQGRSRRELFRLLREAIERPAAD